MKDQDVIGIFSGPCYPRIHTMGLSGDPTIFAIGHLCFFQLLHYILSAMRVKSLGLLLVISA